MSGEFISIFLASFVTFFVLIDALGVAPVFASLTVRGPASYRRSMATRSVLVGTLIIFGFAFFGAWLLDMELEADNIELSFGWIWDNFGTIGWPLLFGSLVCGWVAGVTGFVVTRVVWRMRVVRRWRERRAQRKARRQEKRAQRRLSQTDMDQT